MSPDRNPLVSIVIPCKNRAHYLVPTIESVLQQDYPHIECIVVDGGSRDGTIEILKKYGDRIIWVSEPDKGHADAINKGLRMSKGEIVAWLNADDLYVVPDAVGKVAAYLQENPQVDVVYGDFAGISKDGEITSGVVKPREWDLVYAVKYCNPVIMQPASFMRRSIVEKVGWLDVSDDHGLWLKIGLVGTIRYAPIHIAYVRRDPGLCLAQYISEGKVTLTEHFFEQPDLPSPFNEKKFRRRALSNAHVIAAIGIWAGTKKIRLSLIHIGKALAADPLNGFYILTAYPLYVLFYSLPLRWKEKIRERRWFGIQGIAGGSRKGKDQ